MDLSEKYSRLQATMDQYAHWVKQSAETILPYVDIAGKSVVDFGCGRGDWLMVATELGAENVVGLDSYALDAGSLPIPAKQVDLTKPVILEESFDVALCLEVAEHLDASAASILVQSLVNAAPVILFSAGIPGQGGIGHVNEQPPGYWHALFKTHGYHCYDFRTSIWNHETVEPWYRMNVLVFAKPGTVPAPVAGYAVDTPLHLVHPDIFAAYTITGKDIILHYDDSASQWTAEILDD